MHIVYVHRSMVPESIGGTYTYIFELGRRLASRGHRFDLIVSTKTLPGGGPEDLEGMRVHRYPFRRINPVLSTLQHLNKTYNIYSEIEAEEPVDILSVNDSHLGLKVARSGLGRRACQIPTFHAPLFLEFRLNTDWQIASEASPFRRAALRATEPPLEHWQRRFETKVLEAGQGILVLSRFTRSLIEKHFPTVDLSRVRIIPSGVDTERFRPAEDRSALRRKLGLPEDAVCLVTVRNLSPRMGLENLVDAMARVRSSDEARGLDLRLAVCGEGRLRGALESRIERLGLGGVITLLGRVTDEALVEHYQASDLFVLPTTAMEGFGIVTVEALSTNLPVVGTPAGATPEILTPIDPKLVTRDTSSDAIADGITSWLRRRSEEAGTTRYRDEVMSKYTWDDVAAQIESYYEETLAAFRTGAAASSGKASRP